MELKSHRQETFGHVAGAAFSARSVKPHICVASFDVVSIWSERHASFGEGRIGVVIGPHFLLK
jgi:hypothetical protein